MDKNTQHKQTLEDLLHRTSVKMVVAPGPNDEELDLIMRAAMTAPDHGALMPWRFKIIRGEEAVKEFTDKALHIRHQTEPAIPAEKIEATRQLFSQIPLIIAVACHIDYNNTKIRENERVLATACAAMQILNASQALGYGAYWGSGMATYEDELQEMLGFDPLEYRYIGYITIGTPRMQIPTKERPDWRQFTENWPR
ncbi:nitroreductase family protein [Brackiella oedipodis]|uniref:nitroreductase family protein n=1 Tax=Brackiella oedipodis TaxID=124225 RepID=UPI00049175E5|nr:nitroreductase [Brackiella oedipodis]